MNAKSVATQAVLARSEGVVQWGPFQKMSLSSAVSWGDGDLGARLLGIYEQELHGPLESVIATGPSCVVNVGCAEGYVAVGLARRLPDARVVAVDISQKALDTTSSNADLNGLTVETALTVPDDVPDGAFWFVDVEGAEANVLHPFVYPGLRASSIIVELHPWVDADAEEKIRDRFEDTHTIVEIVQGDRSVNRFDMLADLTDEQRWALASEGRPERMKWLWLTPRSVS